MIKLGIAASLFGGLVILASCATLNENECQTVNWQQLGDSDGSQGFSANRIAKHNKACQKHGIAPNIPAYETGWRAGIARYCTPQNGFRVGRTGGIYRNACPSELSGAFLAAYTPARKLHNTEKLVRETESAISGLVSEISRLAHSKKPEDKEKLKNKTNELSYKQNSLPGYRADLEIARRDVNDYLKANPSIQAF